MPREFDSSNFLSSLSDFDLLIETKAAIKTEREATAVVVRYFKEINERELYLKHACSSLFQFATEKLGYCAGSAQLRINAMRLIEALPETERKIESGELSLTAAAKVQTFIMLEKKAKRHVSTEQKREIVNACTLKSTREVERELAKRSPEIAKVESVKLVGRDRFQVSFSISEETEAKMKKLKGLLAHTNPHVTTEELFKKLIELGLEKFDPARKAERSLKRQAAAQTKRDRAHATSVRLKKLSKQSDVAQEIRDSHLSRTQFDEFQSFHAHETNSVRAKVDAAACVTSVEAGCVMSGVIAGAAPRATVDAVANTGSGAEVGSKRDVKNTAADLKRSRYIKAAVRHRVWAKNAGRGCEFAEAGASPCGSQHALQVDHVRGFAIGGSHEASNLRVVCAKHNRFVWRVQRHRQFQS